MRQTLGFIALWCGVTVLAASITWFGVRDVLRSQVFDDAKIESLGVALAGMEATPLPSGAATGSVLRPEPPSVSPSPSGHRPTPHATPVATGSPPHRRPIRSSPQITRDPARLRNFTASAPPPSATATAVRSVAPSGTGAATDVAVPGNVRVVSTESGSVSLTVVAGACRLVAVVPEVGAKAGVLGSDGWIRVDLTRGEGGSAVFCGGKESRIDTWEY